MSDSYEVLGISPSATESQIKKAYKNLAKKAADLPMEESRKRMAELDSAYDDVMNRRMGSSGYTQTDFNNNSSYQYPYDEQSDSNYYDVKNLIDSGRYEDACTILDGVPVNFRDAEWHFLKGRALYSKGRLEEASREFEYAYRNDPANDEYRNVYEDVYKKRSGGYRYAREKRGCGSCDICSSLICADCCCESMGGDLIPCC